MKKIRITSHLAIILKIEIIRSQFFKSLYGLGCNKTKKIIRTGRLMGTSNIGIIPLDDYRYTIRISKKGIKQLSQTKK